MKNIAINGLVFIVIILILAVLFGKYMRAGDWILFFSFIALMFYARETKKIREIEQKPIIDFLYRPGTNKHEQYLRLRNTGKGSAYNVRVETIVESNKAFDFYIDDPNLILIPNSEQTLIVSAKYKDKNGNLTWPGDSINFFLTNCVTKKVIENDKRNEKVLNKDQKTEIKVFYKNSIGQEYKRTFYIYDQLTKTDIPREYEIKFIEERKL